MLSNARAGAVLPASDLKRAREFYERKLGLKVKEADEKMGEVWYECGQGTVLSIYQRPPVKVEHTQVAFQVDDIEAEIKELRLRGVVFEEYDIPEMGLKTVNGIATMGNYRAAWFKDTEGNILNIGQKS